MSRPIDLNRYKPVRPTASDGKFDASVFVATALVVRALRGAGLSHALHGGPCVVGITGVSLNAAELVTDAANQLLKTAGKLVGSGGYTTVTNCVVPRQRLSTTVEGLIDALHDGGRVCCIFASEEDVPAGFRAMADGMASLPPVDTGLVRAACLLGTGQFPSKRDLEALISLPLSLLDFASRPGRAVSRGVMLSRRIAAAELAEAEVEKKPTQAAPSVALGSVPPGPKVEDLHGLGEVGEWGRSLATDLVDYKAGRIGWADLDRGALISGPPGTGKTTFALALGRTCQAPVFIHSLAQWQAAGYLNALLKCMRQAFAEAKAAAPSILFVDELDSFGDRLNFKDHNASYTREVINGFLECLDGAEARTGVVVIGATNYPQLIDPAIRRAGRLDRHLQLPLPDEVAREGIMRFHLRGDLGGDDVTGVASATEGMSGADIEQLVRAARRRARTERRPMLLQDIRGSLPRAIKLTDELHRRLCVHEAGHVVVGIALAEQTGSVPVSARADRDYRAMQTNQTVFTQVEGFDRTSDSCLALATVTLAGMAAEDVLLGHRGELSGGHEDSDLSRATLTLARMEYQHGMGDTLLTMGPFSSEALDVRLRSDAGARGRIEVKLGLCLDRARVIVGERRAEVEAVALRLATNGTWSVSRPEGAACQETSDRDGSGQGDAESYILFQRLGKPKAAGSMILASA